MIKTYSTQDFSSMIPTTFSSIKRKFENVSAPLEVSDSDHWYESVVKLKAPIIADTDEDIDIMSLC